MLRRISCRKKNLINHLKFWINLTTAAHLIKGLEIIPWISSIFQELWQMIQPEEESLQKNQYEKKWGDHNMYLLRMKKIKLKLILDDKKKSHELMISENLAKVGSNEEEKAQIALSSTVKKWCLNIEKHTEIWAKK